MKKLRVAKEHHWCPACGCDVSDLVHAGVQAALQKLAKMGAAARNAKLTPEQRSKLASCAGKARQAQRKARGAATP